MDQVAEYLPSNNVVALIIASLIFIVTVTLVAKKLISFLITIVLLFFAIASGMAIANNDLVREYLSSIRHDKDVILPAHKQETAKETTERTLEQIRDDFITLLNQLIHVLSPEQKQEVSPSSTQQDQRASKEAS